jgi:diaminopimelate epimerase
MLLAFTKMHGLGNDFVLIDAIQQPIILTHAEIALIADRRRGIGCDQVLLIEAARTGDADFRYRVYNADGGEVEQCGNGARCAARYLHDQGSIERDARLETAAGLIAVHIEVNGWVTVDMGAPRLEPNQIPFAALMRAPSYQATLDDAEVELMAISMGNPHAILRVDDIDTAPVARLGPRLETHPLFPNRTNVGFMQVVDRATVRLRVFERGVGETQACGSGACAAVVAGRVRGWLDERVKVELSGGSLMISWPGLPASVLMTGSATKVFEGSIAL